MAQASLLGLRYGQKLDADALRAAPSDRRIFDFDRLGFTGKLKEQRHLHPSERANQAFHTTAFGREVSDRTFVPKLVPLNQCTGQGDNKASMFASDHALGPFT